MRRRLSDHFAQRLRKRQSDLSDSPTTRSPIWQNCREKCWEKLSNFAGETVLPISMRFGIKGSLVGIRIPRWLRRVKFKSVFKMTEKPEMIGFRKYHDVLTSDIFNISESLHAPELFASILASSYPTISYLCKLPCSVEDEAINE